MNFEPTEDRRMLADTLGRFIADRYAIEHRHSIAYGEHGFDETAWAGFADLGTVGALFPETHGGYGGSGFDIATVFESLGKGLVVEPFLGSLMAGHALMHAGGHDSLLEQIVSGDVRAAVAWEEAGSRYDPAVVETLAVREGDDWKLNGDKCAVRQADAAAWLLVSARVNGKDGFGIGLFLVPADSPGLTLRSLGTIDGGSISEVLLRDVPAVAVGGGFFSLERAIDAGLLALCAESLGAMQVVRDATIEYLQIRKQFNVAIGSFQALQHRMATVLLEIEQARSSVINAAVAFDGQDCLRRQRALSAAKMSIGRIGTLVSEEAIQMHGGIGMTWELPLSHYAKRLIMIDHQLGDEDYHLERYVAVRRLDMEPSA